MQYSSVFGVLVFMFCTLSISGCGGGGGGGHAKNITEDFTFSPNAISTVYERDTIYLGPNGSTSQFEYEWIDLPPSSVAQVTIHDSIAEITIPELNGEQEHTFDIQLKISNYDGDTEYVDFQLTIRGYPNLEDLNLRDLRLMDCVNDYVERYQPLDLGDITQLSCDERSIRRTEGIELLSELSILTLADNGLIDLEGINQLDKLTTLNLSGNPFAPFQDVGPLKNLTRLSLGGDNSHSPNLPIDSLSGLSSLEELSISYASNENYLALFQIPSLNELNLWYSPINGMAQFRNILRLDTLSIHGAPLLIADELELLNWLYELRISDSGFIDLGLLSNFTSLGKLNISGNGIQDLQPISGLTNLNTLNFSNNEIHDLAPLSAMIDLRYLYASYNDIEDVSVLFDLPILRTLHIDNNWDVDCIDISELRSRRGDEIYIPYHCQI